MPCLDVPIYREWAESGDPVLVAHVRQVCGDDPLPPHVPVSETIALIRSVKACQWRSTEGCGCSGSACALRGGSMVSHLDCFDCIRRYG